MFGALRELRQRLHDAITSNVQAVRRLVDGVPTVHVVHHPVNSVSYSNATSWQTWNGRNWERHAIARDDD